MDSLGSLHMEWNRMELEQGGLHIRLNTVKQETSSTSPHVPKCNDKAVKCSNFCRWGINESTPRKQK